MITARNGVFEKFITTSYYPPSHSNLPHRVYFTETTIKTLTTSIIHPTTTTTIFVHPHLPTTNNLPTKRLHFVALPVLKIKRERVIGRVSFASGELSGWMVNDGVRMMMMDGGGGTKWVGSGSWRWYGGCE